MRILPDVNVLAIQLVEDHPGYPYVTEQLSPALAGDETMLLFGYLPLRVQWVLEDLGFSTVEARNAVRSLLCRPMETVGVSTETVLESYDISVEKNYDVYDCFYLAVAREADATHLLTTDRDFESLCADEPFEYLNPVPEDVLTRFETAGE